MKAELKVNAQRRMSRISGQIAGIERMVESGRPCQDILQQVTAVRSALDQLGVLLLTEHLQSCVLGQGVDSRDECCVTVGPNDQAQQIKEAITRFLK
jgi:CsoR family transcriptional regulator, copper-sensing transcriptional repressor